METQRERSVAEQVRERKHLLVWAGLLGGLLSFAGCQSGTEESPGGQPSATPPSGQTAAAVKSPDQASLDACTLLTTSEVAAVLGGEVQAPTSTGNMYGGTSCTYEAASERVIAPTVNLMTWPGYTMAELQKSLKENALVSAFEPVPGVGDEAAWGANTLYVSKGGTLFSVAAAGPGEEAEAAAREAAIGLAQKAIPRLP